MLIDVALYAIRIIIPHFCKIFKSFFQKRGISSQKFLAKRPNRPSLRFTEGAKNKGGYYETEKLFRISNMLPESKKVTAPAEESAD